MKKHAWCLSKSHQTLEQTLKIFLFVMKEKCNYNAELKCKTIVTKNKNVLFLDSLQLTFNLS